MSNSLAPTPPSKDDPSRHTGRYPAPPGSHHSSYPTEPETFIPGLLPPMYPPRVHDSQSTGPAQTLRATLDHLPNPQNNDPLMPRHLPNVNRDFTIPDSISTHPDDKPSLSRRLFSHLITKPTLSRTWENRNYAEDTRSNDTSSRDLESAEQNAYVHFPSYTSVDLGGRMLPCG